MKASSELFTPTNLPQTLLDLRNRLAQQPTPEAAWDIVKEYFFFFGTTGVRADMWQMLSATLTNKEVVTLRQPVNRYNLIFFYEFTLMFMDAVELVLHHQRKENTGT